VCAESKYITYKNDDRKNAKQWLLHVTKLKTKTKERRKKERKK